MPPKKFRVSVDGTEYQVEIKRISRDGIEVFLNGKQYEISFVEIEEQTSRSPSVPKSIAVPNPLQTVVEADPNRVVAPLPGDVVEIMIGVGDSVEAGDGIIVLESMKMKNVVRSSRAGKVKSISVTPGQSVAYGDLLVEFE